MRIVIAPDSFKEALPATEVCQAIARGIRQVHPEAVLDLVPMADGGEGTVTTLIEATGGSLQKTRVTGPLGQPVEAIWGLLGPDERTAICEMAAASGLALVPPAKRNPLRTTTFGTGELIRTALDAGARRIIIGIGGSATNDGGTGAAQAIGVTFFDSTGRACPDGLAGGNLGDLARIDMHTRDPRMADTEILVACDVDNPLCGPRGAARIYAPQKGATPEQAELLDRNLGHLADLIARDIGLAVRDLPGSGAAGGLGAGLVAFFGASLRPGIELVIDAVHLARRIAGADLVITGEGRLDAQSMMGKVIAGVGRIAKQAGVPVIALAGTLGEGVEQTRTLLESYHAINPPGTPLADALPRTAERLEATAACVLKARRTPSSDTP